MKKLLSFIFSCALVFGTVLPIYADDQAVAVSIDDIAAIKNGSMASLQGSTNAFYALSVLADGADEAQMQGIEATTLKEQESAATALRASSQDVEKLILLAEGLGYDSTKYMLDGKEVNLFTLLEEKNIGLVNDYTFALEALYSAQLIPDANSKLHKDTLIQQLLSMRNPQDQAWNYNADYSSQYGISDPDTTAMVLSSLAPYANNSAEAMGISSDTKAAVDLAVVEGFTYLSSKQGTSGAMDNGYGENASSTAMSILALRAYGKNISTDPSFLKDGKSLLDGLMSYKNAENLGFDNANWQTGAMELDLDFSTEQGLRALVALQNSSDGEPYYLYQAGAFANEERFKEPVEQPEIKPVEPPVAVEPPVTEHKTETVDDSKETIIKNTAQQSNEEATILLLILAGAGVCAIRKYA